MDNQHKQIKGYRDLSQQEIDLMNRIKEHGEKTGILLEELRQYRKDKFNLSMDSYHQSMYALRVAKEHLQTGQMWFVRAVALPESF
jgi:hypothetical protein